MSCQHQTSALIEHLFRREAGRITAHLTRLLGPAHLDIAEDAVQQTMLRALQTWPYQGVPEQAAAWLYKVAHNAAIDAVRKNRLAVEKADAVLAELNRSSRADQGDPDFEEQLRDDELCVIFLCSHPEVAPEARAALSLKIAGGFSVREIARAFLTKEAAVAQRLVRAKAQIRAGRVTLEVPRGPQLRERLDSALAVIYLIFNEGYAVHEGAGLIRRELCFEALRLGLAVAASQISTPRVHALVALMALQAARLEARVNQAGDVVLLDAQDRSRWDAKLIALGFRHFDQSIAGDEVSEYHVQAAVAATHARAADAESTEWPVILQLYDQLLGMSGSPVVALNRAVAVAKVRGPAAGLAAIEAIESDPKLRHYYLLLATRGHLLMELGRGREAAECFRAALECRCSEPERRFLRMRIETCKGRI